MLNSAARATAVLIAAGLCPAPSPALAMARNAAPSAVTSSAPQDVAKQRYCIEDTITGSHIRHRMCKTREQWIAQDGFDPLKK